MAIEPEEGQKEAGCFIYEGWKNYTADLTQLGYQGIPQNLLFNIFGGLVIILIFSFIRKKAWNYGRLAFKQTALPEDGHQHDRLYGGISSNFDTYRRGRSRTRRLQKEPTEIFVDDRGLFSWIFTTIRLTDEQIRAKSGADAVHYLSFQRHLIFLGTIIMIVSVVIVLPCNFQGEGHIKIDDFDSARIQNLGDSGKFVWVHISLTMFYVFLTVIVLRHFSKSLAFAHRDPVISRTVMISRIAKRNSHAEKVKAHFHEIYPDIEIEEVSFAYNISKLQYAESEKTAASSARAYWEHYHQVTGTRPLMRPYTCGKLLCCCEKCGWKKVDAIIYYTKQEEIHQRFVELERKKALGLPLGIGFVTFKTFEMAHRVVMDYRFFGRCLKAKPYSTFSRKLRSNQWSVKYAPLPEDLYWENLNLSYKAWYFKSVIVNGVLIVVVIVYSTPVIVLNVVTQQLDLNKTAASAPIDETGEESDQPAESESTAASFVKSTVPTLLLWITAVSLPGLVSVSDSCLGFWTKTAENRSRMCKTYLFLLFQVIILPSLGAQSISSFFDNSDVKLECIFTLKNNVFFVNYVITSSLLGASSELLRLNELLCYALKLYFAKSAAELDSIRKSVLWEYQFGSQYAWTMLNFTMFVMFNLISPVITPFGLLYLIMKHFIDRYNIYFAYAPSKVDKEVHVTAINFALTSMFLLQIIMLSYTTFTSNNLLKVVTVITFCITMAFFIGQVFFNMCTNFSPIVYQKSMPKDSVDFDVESFIPPSVGSEVIHEENEDEAVLESAYSYTSNDISGSVRKKVLDGEAIGRYFPSILRRDSPDGHHLIQEFPSDFTSTVAPSLGTSSHQFIGSQAATTTATTDHSMRHSEVDTAVPGPSHKL